MNTDPGPELDTTGTGAGGLLLLVITVLIIGLDDDGTGEELGSEGGRRTIVGTFCDELMDGLSFKWGRKNFCFCLVWTELEERPAERW